MQKADDRSSSGLKPQKVEVNDKGEITKVEDGKNEWFTDPNQTMISYLDISIVEYYR